MKQYKIIGHQNDTIADYEDSLYEYENALDEANDSIDELNSVIDDARGYAWSNYYDMGNALDNLYTLDTISHPR